MNIIGLLLYVTAFAALWIGSSLIVTTIRRFTERIKVPPYVFSFFIVGMLTSVGEIAVAINAVSINQPEIFVGSLLGGTLIIFSVILPVAAIASRGIKIHKHLKHWQLIAVLAITAAPALLILDQKIDTTESFILVGLYLALFFIVKVPAGAFERVEKTFVRERKSLRENTLLRLALGGLLVFLASRDIVTQTVEYSNELHISAFLVSLVVIAIGMNLPELTLAIKAGTSRDKKVQDIAIGDLMGSAAANVLIMGVFSLLNVTEVTTTQRFVSVFVFIALALVTFYLFTRGKSKLTAKKGIVMILLYVAFVVVQILLQR